MGDNREQPKLAALMKKRETLQRNEQTKEVIEIYQI
jgi:hypothetical protein